MAEEQKLKIGDPCPNCGGDLAVDESQDVDRLVEARKRNAASPAVAARYEEMAREKADKFGAIHKCARCGYAARLKADEAAGDESEAATAGAGDSKRRSRAKA